MQTFAQFHGNIDKYNIKKHLICDYKVQEGELDQGAEVVSLILFPIKIVLSEEKIMWKANN